MVTDRDPASSDPAALAAFLDRHRPALEADEVRHNLILGLLARAAGPEAPPVATWTLGGPGACALRLGDRHLVLGALDRGQCGALAEATAGLDYPGVVGTGETTDWFVARARALGAAFGAPMPQRLYALAAAPRYPGAPGHARPVTADDVDLVADWMAAFAAEAVPHDPPPGRAEAERLAGSGRALFWSVGGTPVSMAAIVRQTRSTAAIAQVYTPPAERGRGYAGSATAATVEAAYARGKATACLYTDLRNPLSNRCYVKIGFAPVCDAAFWPRLNA